jgi:DNA-binding transcriptional LysR family regulator
MSELDLTKVRAFVAVAEHRHFRRAAEELHIAQPALSRQVQALERQLAAQLLVRDRRTVELTPAGRQFFDDARPLLVAADAARRRVQRAVRGAKALVVGFRSGVIPTAAVALFTEAHPDVNVEVERLDWDEQEEAVLSGRVDLAYVRRPITERGLRLVPLFAERRLAALRVDHPLADRDEVTVADLADDRHLRYLEPARAGSVRTTALRSIEEKLEYVVGGSGIIVLPLSATLHYTRPDVVYVPVVDAEPDEVLLAFVSGRRSRLMTAFTDAARAAAARDPELALVG